MLIGCTLLVVTWGRKREDGLMQEIVGHIHQSLSLLHIIHDVLILIRIDATVIVDLFDHFSVGLLFSVGSLGSSTFSLIVHQISQESVASIFIFLSIRFLSNRLA